MFRFHLPNLYAPYLFRGGFNNAGVNWFVAAGNVSDGGAEIMPAQAVDYTTISWR